MTRDRNYNRLLRTLGMTNGASGDGPGIPPNPEPELDEGTPTALPSASPPETAEVMSGRMPGSLRPGSRVVGRRDRRHIHSWNQLYSTALNDADTWRYTVDQLFGFTFTAPLPAASPLRIPLTASTIYRQSGSGETMPGLRLLNKVPYATTYYLCVRYFSASCSGTTQDGAIGVAYEDISGDVIGLDTGHGTESIRVDPNALITVPMTDPNPTLFGTLLVFTVGLTVANLWVAQVNISAVFVLPLLESHEYGDLTGVHNGKGWEHAEGNGY